MVANSKGIEIDTFPKPTVDKEATKDSNLKQAQTPKHCNRGPNRLQGPPVANFQPRAYPPYGQTQQAAFRAPGIYNPNQRSNTYYGAPVMVSPGGYLRHGAAAYYNGGGDFDPTSAAAAYGQYAAANRFHPVYSATGDLNGRSTYDPRSQAATGNSQNGMDFSRTVSSSFGESNSKSSNENKGRNEKDSSLPVDTIQKFDNYYNRKNDDDRSVASKADSDRSWKLLNQVASIEEEKMRHDEAERFGATSPLDEHLDSNRSGSRPKFSDMPSPSKLAPLNSLSSVASVQEPLDTTNSKDELDLLQCASSGSLLFNTHDDTYAKRTREEREEQDYGRGGDMDEIRKAASGSPPNVGDLSMKDEDFDDGERPIKKARSTNEEDFYDQPPSYTFSLESAASFSKDQQFSSLPALPEKPRQSSYLGPLENRDKNGNTKDDMLESTNFWEIKGQDSFNGGLSVESAMTGNAGDGPLITSSFSFGRESNGGVHSNDHDGFEDSSKLDERRSVQSQDSNMNMIKHERERSSRNNHVNTTTSRRTHHGTEKYPPPSASWVTTSSSFNRGDQSGYGRKMQSGLYPTNQMAPQVRGFHPNASIQSQQQIRAGQMKNDAPNMLRNFSQDSSGKTTTSSAMNSVSSRLGPLHGPYGTLLPPHIPQSDAHLPPSFRPPHPTLPGAVSIRAPPQAVYIMSSPPGGRQAPTMTRHVSTTESNNKQSTNGVYNWTKQDDSRLTDIMKKFKNPKDWEPIAKEFGRGKTAKECHERWIRYLKPGVRKGQWQDHEDAIVVEAVTTSKEQPFTRWSDLAQRLPGRVGKQIRDRWVNHLNPNINHMPFTREDDLLLWEGHKKLGKRWVEISSKYFNSSRSENHIKNRWYSASFKKFVANEFGPEAYNGGKKKDSKVSKK